MSFYEVSMRALYLLDSSQSKTMIIKTKKIAFHTRIKNDIFRTEENNAQIFRYMTVNADSVSAFWEGEQVMRVEHNAIALMRRVIAMIRSESAKIAILLLTRQIGYDSIQSTPIITIIM